MKANFYPPRLFKYLPSNLEGKTILDAGCELGEFVYYLRSKTNDSNWGIKGNSYIVGIDIDDKCIKFLKQINLYNEIYHGNLLSIRDIIKRRFDIGILNNVLEHNPKEDALKILSLVEDLCDYILVAVPLGNQLFTADKTKFYKNHLSIWETSDLASRGYKVEVEDVAFYPDGFGKAYKIYRKLLGRPAHQQIIAVRVGWKA